MPIQTIEELKAKFPKEEVSPYGPCLIIPGTEFDPDSEDPLEEQGYRIINMSFKGKMVTLVKLTKKEQTPDVHEPPVEKAKNDSVKRGRGQKMTTGFCRWTADDQAKLLRLWDETPGIAAEKTAALTAQFPNRTAKALDLQHLKLLHKTGQKSKKSKHWAELPVPPISKRGYTSGEEIEKNEVDGKEEKKEAPEIMDTILDSVKSLAEAIDKLAVLMAEDHLLHEKLSCQVIMHGLEISEVEEEFQIPLSLKLLLKNALLSNDGIHCAVFKARTNKFLEAVRPVEM